MVYLVVPLSGANAMRQLMPAVTALSYFATPENRYGEFASHLPSWLVPRGSEVIRAFFEGSEEAGVPWAAWAGPLAVWALIFIGLNVSLFSLLTLFRRPWSEHERLQFPLAELAVQLSLSRGTPVGLPFPPPAGGEKEEGGVGGLLGHKLFWLGVGVAALYNLTNIAHAFNPSVPALGQGLSLNLFLTERPWTGLRPLYLAFRPEIVGLGYLVNLDVLLSVWVCYLLLRWENFFAQLLGYQVAGMPFEWPQGNGAYLALAFFLLYTARRHLKDLFRQAFTRGRATTSTEVLSPRAALCGFVGGSLLLMGLWVKAGVTVLASGWVIVLLTVSAFVYTRIRAQTGLPISYCLPRRDIPVSLIDLVGASPLLTGGGVRGATVFSLMTVLPRLIFPQMVATQFEGLRMAERTGIPRRHFLATIALGVLLGVALGYWSHLTAYYHYGCNILDGGVTEGGWRTRQALIQYERLQNLLNTQAGPKWLPTAFRGVGLAFTTLLILLRTRFLQFPLSPLGFAIAATFGYHIWFPIFVVWMLKTFILHLGGPRLYRRLEPAFMGLAVGHFLVAGAIWALVGTVSEEAARRYLVWFA